MRTMIISFFIFIGVQSFGQSINLPRENILTVSASGDCYLKLNLPSGDGNPNITISTTGNGDLSYIPLALDVCAYVNVEHRCEDGTIAYLLYDFLCWPVNISYGKTYEKFRYDIEGINLNVQYNTPYGWFKKPTINGSVVLRTPKAPSVIINKTQNSHVDNTIDTPTICECSCSTVFETGFFDERLTYTWMIYDGDNLIKSVPNQGPQFYIDFKELNTGGKNQLRISFIARNEVLTFPESDKLNINLKSQSKFEQLSSGGNVDIYPKFKTQDRIREGWSVLYKMKDVSSKAIQCKNELANAVNATGRLLDDNKQVLFYNDAEVFMGKIAPYVLRAQVGTGDKTFSEKSCYAQEDLIFPVYENNDAFTVATTGSINQQGNSYYICSANEKNKISITSKRGQSLVVKKNGVVFIKPIDIKYASGATSQTVTVELPITSDSDLGSYEIIYTDILGNALEPYSFNVERVQPIGIDKITIDRVNQLCATTINGKFDGVATITLPAGWNYTKIEVLENGTLVTSDENEANQFTANLAAKNYSAKIDNFKHDDSGCIYAGGEKPFRINHVESKIDFDPQIEDTQYLTCNSSSIEIKVSSSDPRLKIFEKGVEVSSSKQILTAGNTYSYTTSYPGCSDAPIKVTKTVNRPQIHFNNHTVKYNQTGSPYAVIELPFSDLKPFDENWKVKIINRTSNSTATFKLSELMAANVLKIPVDEKSAKQDFEVSVFRGNCDPVTTFNYPNAISVFDRLSFSPSPESTSITNCTQLVTTLASEGSGSYTYYRRGNGIVADEVYNPKSTDFKVGSYTVYAVDSDTKLKSADVSIIIGVAQPIKIYVPSVIDVDCYNYPAKVPVTITGGKGDFEYKIGNEPFKKLPDNNSFTVENNLYNSFTNKSTLITVRDDFKCTSTTDYISFSIPQQVVSTIDDVNSRFVTQCDIPAVVKLIPSNGIAPYTYHYTYSVNGVSVQSSSPTSIVSLKENGLISFYVKDSKKCSSTPITRNIASNDVTIGFLNSSIFRVSRDESATAVLNLTSSMGTKPYLFSYGLNDDLPDSNKWTRDSTFSVGVGTYTFYVKDSLNCSKKIKATILNPFDGLSITPTKENDPQCNGSSSGVLNVSMVADANMKLKELVAKNVTTGVEKSVDLVKSVPPFSFNGLAPGTYSIFVRNTSNTESGANLVSFTEKQDVDISIVNNLPLYHGASTSVTSADVKFKVVENSNSISSVSYRLNEQDTWQQLSKDVDSYYVFKALKGGVYSVKIAKCNSSNTTIKPINVLEIPLPNFDASILHPKDAEEKGTVILSTTETSTDTRYSYSVALINADNDTQVEKKLIDPSQAQVVFDNVIPGNFKVKVYSIYNVDKQTLGDQVIENIKVNLPLKVTVDKDKSLINVCYQSKANFSMLTNLITVDEKVVKAITASGGVGGKPYKYYFVSATNATQRVEMKDGVELDPGTYFVKVVDDKGTEATGANPVEVRMAQPIAIQVLGSIELPCFESVKEIQLVASGGWGNYGVGTLTNDAIPVESREVAGANGVYAVEMGRGNYHFKLTDATGCSGTKAFELMSPLKKLEVAVSDRSKIDLECDGGKSGKVILDVTGGTPFKPETYSYSYSLELATTGVGSNTIENLGAGSYIFYVTDKNGCTQNVRQEIVTSYRPQNLNFEVDKTAATCKNRADGSITLKNPSGMFTYELYRNGSVQNLGFKSSTNGSLEAGAYTVKWINSANAKCSYSQPVLISEPDAISIDNLHIVPGCNGDGKGIILFDLKGGTKPWKVDVDGNTPIMVSSEGRVTFDKLANGSHKVSISDNNTCPLEFSPVVNSLTEDTKMLSAVAHACEGGGSGAAILTPSDSTRSQAWQFFKNVDGEFLQIPYESKYSRFKTVGLAPSTYKAILTDSETKCKIADRVISIHPKIDIVSVTPDRVTCKGGKALVKIDLGKTSDPVTYYYLKKDSNIEVEFTPAADALASGEYTLVVKSDYCAASKQFTVLEPDKALDLSVTPTTIKTVNGVSYHVSCNRGSNGTLSVTPSGGWLDYRLTVDGTPMGLVPEVSRLTGGNHTVRIDDKEGCFVEKGIVLNEPSTPLVLDEVKKWQVKQDGSIADTVILKPTGGFAGYQVGLDALSMKKRVGNDGDEVQLTFTGAGVFRFTASDTLGCEVAKEVMLDQLSQLKYVKQVALPTCFGGNDGKITITEGAESYSYTLKRGSDILTQKGNGVFVGLKSGSYSLKVTDGTFTEYSSVEIRDPERVIISADVDSTCHFISNGVVRVKLVNGTGINRYSLTLTEAGGTTLTNEVQGDLDAQLTELNSGTYTLVATNLNSTCADSDTDKATFHIGRLAALCPTISSVHFCGDEKGKVVGNFNVGQHTFTAELLTRRAATGIWETLSSTVAGGSVNNLAPEVTPGWYRFRTTDRRYGCQELTDSVVVYSSPRISKVEVDNEVCFGQKGTLRVFAEKGSEKLSIFQGQAEFERIFNNTVHLSPGTYKLLVHDDLSGCSQSYPTPVAIDGPAQKFAFSFNPSLYGSYNIDCNGNATGSVAVSLAGGGTLQGAAYGDKTFTSRSFNINQLATGWHRLTATDSFGCTIKDSVELKEPSKLAISIAESSQHLECSSANIGFVRLSAAGGSSGYQFAMNQSAFGVGSSYGNLAVGDYTFRVKDSNGCTDEVKTVIDTRYLPFDIHLDAKNVSCFGAKDGKITAVNDGSQTYTYSWHNSAITASCVEKLQPGTYGVTIATAAGCTKDLFAQITEPQLLSFTTTAKSACPGEVNGLVNFEANGGTKPYAFLLNDQPFGAIGKDLSAAYGLYLAKVVDANGCTAMQTLNIDKKEGSISANFLVATTSASSDTLVLVDISNPKADYIRWDLSNDGSPIRRINGENDQAPQVKFDREGDYRINMTAYYGDCEYTISKVISVKNGVVSDGTKTFVLGANGIKDFDVFPNPSRGQSKFRIRLFQPYAAVLQVFDMGGHLVSTQDIPQGTENEGVVAFNTKTSGAFIVRVMLKNKKDYREVKVIVQ